MTFALQTARPAEPQEIGGYAKADWRAGAPRVTAAWRADSGVGALRQVGHSASPESQDVSVPAMAFDAVLLLGRGHDVTATFDGQRARFGPSGASAVYFQAGVSSRWFCAPTEAPVVHLYIPTRFRDWAIGPQGDGRSVTFYDAVHPLTRMLEHLSDSLAVDDCGSSLALESYAALVLHSWQRAATRPATGGLPPHTARRLDALMRARLHEDLTLSALAAEAGLSAFHFVRAFKASFGVTPHRHLTNLRLEAAYERLLAPGASVTSVALEVGYAEPGHLARQFRRRFGVTPGAHMRRGRS